MDVLDHIMHAVPSSAHCAVICARTERSRFVRAVATALVVLFAATLALAVHAQADDSLPTRGGWLAWVLGTI